MNTKRHPARAAPGAGAIEETHGDLIVLEGVTFNYGSVVALSDVDLGVPAGILTGLVGPNGAGKSTIINLLAGIIEPTAGTARVLGHAPGSMEVRRRTGFLLEDEALFEYLTGRELLEFVADAHGVSESDTAERISELVRFFQLTDSIDRLTDEYSTGTRKKLALAAALVHGPSLLVLDEPFESLDPLIVKRLKIELGRFASSGGTALLSSHLLDAVEAICHHVAILLHGRIVFHGDTTEAVQQARTRLGGAPLEDLYSTVVGEGVAPTLDWLHGSSDADQDGAREIVS